MKLLTTLLLVVYVFVSATHAESHGGIDRDLGGFFAINITGKSLFGLTVRCQCYTACTGETGVSRHTDCLSQNLCMACTTAHGIATAVPVWQTSDQ